MGRRSRRATLIAIWFTVVAAVAGLAGSAVAAERAPAVPHVTAGGEPAAVTAAPDAPGARPDVVLGAALRQAGEQASLVVVAVLALLGLAVAARDPSRLRAQLPATLSTGGGRAARLRGPPLLQVA